MARRDDESPIPKGRFFKKDDPVLKNVEVTEYSLLDVCEIEVALADNSFANIYHRNLREQEELESKVEENAGIHGDLSADEAVRHVLGPGNFTEEWVRQKEKATRNYFESEDDNFEEAIEEREADGLASTETQADQAADQSPTPAPGQPEGSEGFQPMVPEAGIAAANQDAGQSQMAENEDQLGHIKESFHAVSHNQQYDVEPLVAAAELSHETAASQGSAANQGSAESANLTSPEAPASAAPAEGELPSQEELDQLRNEAKADGFDEGLREAQQAMGELTQQLGQSIAEVEGLKEQLLDNSRQNFKAIAKTMVGAILQKHIQLHPEALDRIISRAIQETIKADSFSVKVNQETFASLKEVSEFADKLVVDDGVADGHFKVESELSVVDGNLDQIIGSLLDDADLDLFATDEAS